MPADSPIIGHGIYSVSEAARLARLRYSEVDRWAFGYRDYPGIVDPDLPRVGAQKAISFLTLIELCLMSRFKNKGLPAKKFRVAADALFEQRGIVHPFAFERLMTDGRDIFMDEGGEYIQLTGREKYNYVWKLAVEQFFKEIRFEHNYARQWYPPEGGGLIVLDPKVKFGDPIVAGTRVPTAGIVDQVEAGDSPSFVASCYNLTLDQVKAARRFEERYAKAA